MDGFVERKSDGLSNHMKRNQNKRNLSSVWKMINAVLYLSRRFDSLGFSSFGRDSPFRVQPHSFAPNRC